MYYPLYIMIIKESIYFKNLYESLEREFSYKKRRVLLLDIYEIFNQGSKFSCTRGKKFDEFCF